MGRRAGIKENNESWTFRTHKSALDPFNTISKYTPARPDVKHAAVTAPKPLRGLMTWTWNSCALPTAVADDLPRPI